MADLASTLIGAVSSVPSLNVSFSKSTLDGLAQNFHSAGIRSAAPQRYLSGALTLSLLVFLGALAVLFFFLSALEAFAYSTLAFAVAFAFFLFFPRLLADRRTKQAESELPFLLRELAVYIDIGLPFERALAKIGQKKYILSPGFASACQEIKSGGTVQGALSEMSGRTQSLPLKRSLLLLSSIYDTGGSSESLKRTSEELSSTQLSSMRLESSRLSLLSIIFIAASALIPSFFTVFAAVSPALASTAIPDWQIWAAFLFVFPLIDLGALGLMFLFLPPAPPASAASDSKSLLNEYLAGKGFVQGERMFAILLAAISLVLAATFLLLGLPVLSALSICIAPAGYSLAAYFSRKPIEEAEARLSDALYTAASTHRLLSAEKMLSSLAKGGFGRLSDSFALALRRQKSGDSFSASMSAAAAHCPSVLVERAFSLLVVAYETGANMYSALRSAAEDVVAFFTLVRERSAMLSMQRYTILAASGALVPIILGTVVSLAPSLASATAISSGAGGHSLGPLLLAACPIYLLLNAALSSILLSLAETDVKKAALYFAITAPISQILFAFASTSQIS
ncbi:MAG: type II secretion system F family protein [Candidatus Micrarchaeota archaeon]|nr:type II secretion system F family protein [Candidatus Micrarchaeota archaeon]